MQLKKKHDTIELSTKSKTLLAFVLANRKQVK